MISQLLPSNQCHAGSPGKAAVIAVLAALLRRSPSLAIRLGAALRHMWAGFRQA
jgi:hypothetical protein